MNTFVVGFCAGMFAMGILLTAIPGIGWHDASRSKQVCEKSLPRDQECVPSYVPLKTKVTP